MVTAVSTSRESRVYRGEATRAVAMPLGGIGTGTIALAGDGSLRQWQIHNQVNHMACVPHSFFAVWTRPIYPSKGAVARVLQSDALYDTEGANIPPTSSDHIVPLPHRRLLSRLPGVERTEFTGEYPIAKVDYFDPDLPIEVSMEAFSPFVPLNEKDSGLPAICFNLTVTNPNADARHVSVAASLQNAVGWDGIAPIFDTKSQAYGGNANALVRTGDTTTITMGTSGLPEDAPGYGTMALSAQAPGATYLTQWSDLTAFWDDFSADGALNNTADTTPSDKGRTWNGALAVPFKLQPGESRTIPFVIAWHFPNRYVNWSQTVFFDFRDKKSRFWVGNRYNTWFQSAFDAVQYVEQERERLTRETRLTRDTFYDTTLPFPLIESVVSQMSIIRTPTCFWDEGGHFYGFEGCNGFSTSHHTEPWGGCCPLNCTHVWNYEMSLSRLFPMLERDMRDTEWNIQQHDSGYLPHRVLLPTYLPRPWDREIGGPDKPALDGLLGGILKTYREYRASGDNGWLDSVWPALGRALDHLWTAHDPDRTGVIEGEQPNTYDISIYGANTFIGTLYLASLRSIEEMARRRGEADLADECHAVYERGRESLEARLWNGEYYFQEVDLEAYPEQNWGLGCHSDHLLGQWWAHILDLGHLLDPDRVGSAVNSIVRYNFRENFHGFWQSFDGQMQEERQFVTEEDAGLIMCTWPKGGRPEIPTRYSDEVWTGIEYEVAGLLLYEGQVDDALRLIDATRRRYEGTRLNPWNDIECGDHYVRAMSSWMLLEAASGYRYNAPDDAIAFAPLISADDFRAPFFTRDGWGTYSQQTGTAGSRYSLQVAHGQVAIRELRVVLGGPSTQPEITVAGMQVDGDARAEGKELVVTFRSPLMVKAGEEMTIQLR